MSNSRSHFDGKKIETKDIVKRVSGKKNDVEWSIVVYLTASGTFYSIAKAGDNQSIGLDRENPDDAFSDGVYCLAEFFDELGVGNAA